MLGFKLIPYQEEFSSKRIQKWSGIRDLWTGLVSDSLFVIINHQMVPEIPLYWHPDWTSHDASPTQKLYQKFFGRHCLLTFSSENAVTIPNPYSII